MTVAAAPGQLAQEHATFAYWASVIGSRGAIEKDMAGRPREGRIDCNVTCLVGKIQELEIRCTVWQFGHAANQRRRYRPPVRTLLKISERFSNHGIHECISTPPDANLVCWVSEGSPGGFYLRSRCWIVRGLLADNEASPCSSTVTAITFWLFDDLVGEPGAAIARSAPSPFSLPRCKATSFRPLAFCEPENCDPAEKSRSVRPTASARPVVGCSLSQFCPCTSICQQ